VCVQFLCLLQFFCEKEAIKCLLHSSTLSCGLLQASNSICRQLKAIEVSSCKKTVYLFHREMFPIKIFQILHIKRFTFLMHIICGSSDAVDEACMQLLGKPIITAFQTSSSSPSSLPLRRNEFCVASLNSAEFTNEIICRRRPPQPSRMKIKVSHIRRG